MPILYESVFNIDGRTENNVCSRIELADIRPDKWQEKFYDHYYKQVAEALEENRGRLHIDLEIWGHETGDMEKSFRVLAGVIEELEAADEMVIGIGIPQVFARSIRGGYLPELNEYLEGKIQVEDLLSDSSLLKGDDEAFDDVKATFEAPSFGETISYSKLDDYLDEETEGFTGMLIRLIEDSGRSPADVYRKANVSKSVFSAIMRRKSMPKKSNVIALGVSLRLDLDDMDELLNRAGYCLSDHLEYDKIIIFYILKRIYDIDQINLELYERGYGSDLLGSVSR